MVSKAKTPYKRAHGYATSNCIESMDSTLTKSLEAEKLHHVMMINERIVPKIPLSYKTEREK